MVRRIDLVDWTVEHEVRASLRRLLEQIAQESQEIPVETVER